MSTIGTVELIATIDTTKYKSGAKEIERANSDIENSSERTSNSANTSFTKVAKVGLAALAAAAVAVGAVIVTNIGGAIKRVDTLNNSTRVFDAMGFDAGTAKKAIDNLDKSIRGLPTPLDSAVRGMTALAATYGDIELGQKIFTSLNNAILGFGGTADDVNNAILQLSQLPMDGPLDAQTWNSLRNSGLTPVLVAIAKDMGIGVNQLKDDLGEGILTVEDFTNALVKMNTEGGGGMKSLEQLAKESTKGIGTSFANLQTAIQRSIANVIKAFGVDNISGVINDFSLRVTEFGKTVESIVKKYIVPFATELGKVFGEILKNKTVVEGLKLLLIGIGVALGLIVGTLALAIIGIGALAVAVVFLVGVVSDFIDNTTGMFRDWASAIDKFLSEAVNNIYNFFVGLPGFFKGIIDQIIGFFSNLGAVIGNVIGSAFKGAINGVLRFASNMINGFIDAINGVISLVNKIPGVELSKLGKLPIPQLAEGGVVSSATLAMIGEGSEPEAVIPLSKLDKMLNNSNGNKSEINIGTITISDKQTADYFIRKLSGDQEITTSGLVPMQKYMGV